LCHCIHGVPSPLLCQALSKLSCSVPRFGKKVTYLGAFILSSPRGRDYSLRIPHAPHLPVYTYLVRGFANGGGRARRLSLPNAPHRLPRISSPPLLYRRAEPALPPLPPPDTWPHTPRCRPYLPARAAYRACRCKHWRLYYLPAHLPRYGWRAHLTPTHELPTLARFVLNHTHYRALPCPRRP